MSTVQQCLVRRARQRDRADIARLWGEMMAYHQEFDPRFAVAPDGRERYEEALVEMLHSVDHRVLVAQVDQQIVGYTIGMILANPPVFQLDRYGFIAEMCVTAEMRDRQVGRRLWDEAIAWFTSRGVGVVQLNASTINQPGQQFWRGRGCRDFLNVLWYDIPQA